MKKALFVLPLLAGMAFAQGRVGPVGHGFGNVVFPGTGIPQPHQPSGHIPALGAAVRGVWSAQPGGGQHRQNRRGGGPLVLPVPVFVGGFGYGAGGYDYSQQQHQPNITVVNAPQPSPSVIINQNYAPDRGQPTMHEYPANTELGSYQAPVPSHPEPVKPAAPVTAQNSDDDSPTIYLIALKDGTVYPAYAYWLEADTLHYITTKHSHNRTSLALVDERLSLQFNRERSVEFKLKGHPAAAAAK